MRFRKIAMNVVLEGPPLHWRIIFKALRLALERIRAMGGLEPSGDTILRNLAHRPRPSSNFLIHVDASFVSTLVHTGVEGVVRNKEGDWVLVFGKCSFRPYILSSELWATHEGIFIASIFNFSHVALFSDCRLAVKILCNPESNSDKYVSVIFECRKLWRKLPGVKIEQCGRKDNRVADVLAKNYRYADSR